MKPAPREMRWVEMKRNIDASGKRFRFFFFAFPLRLRWFFFFFRFSFFFLFRGVVFPSIFYFPLFSFDGEKKGRRFTVCLFSFRNGDRSFSDVFLLFVLASRWKRKWNSASICLTLLCFCRHQMYRLLLYAEKMQDKDNEKNFIAFVDHSVDWPIAELENSLQTFIFFPFYF